VKHFKYKMNITHPLILTIIRHGQTQGNVNRIVEGITDSPLNDNGMHQAQFAGEYLKYENFDCVLASDLKRCKQTAAIILEKNLNFMKKEGNYAEMGLIRERNFGIHEGTPFAEYRSIANKAGFPFVFDFVPKGAESSDDVKKRAQEFLRMVYGTVSLSNKQRPNILVVTHGLVIAQLITRVYEETQCTGLPKDVLENPRRNILNTAITRFEFEVDQKSLRPTSCRNTLFKSTKHLPE
jgi:broad specificity phosphatase PhoE